MSLLNPIWFWALGALAIPVTIHLLSRKEGKTIRMGSIRFLTETSTSKFSSIRLNEVALLAIRSLLVLVLVVFLAGLILSTIGSAKSTPWVLVETELAENEKIKTLTDSLQKNGYEIRSLAKGFPRIEADTTHQPLDYYKLVEDLSVVHNNKTIVIASNKISYFKGKRIPLPENITWLSYPLQQPASVTSIQADTLRIILAFDKAFEYDKKIIRAAIQAVQASTTIPIIVRETEATKGQKFSTDWLIWLSDGTLAYAGKSLRVSLTPFDNLISQKDKNHWLLTERLNEVNAVEQHLAVQLMQMLFREESLVNMAALTLPDALAWSKDIETKTVDVTEAGKPADKILLLIITLLFTSERILAFYRRQ